MARLLTDTEKDTEIQAQALLVLGSVAKTVMQYGSRMGNQNGFQSGKYSGVSMVSVKSSTLGHTYSTAKVTKSVILLTLTIFFLLRSMALPATKASHECR